MYVINISIFYLSLFNSSQKDQKTLIFEDNKIALDCGFFLIDHVLVLYRKNCSKPVNLLLFKTFCLFQTLNRMGFRNALLFALVRYLDAWAFLRINWV
jgi:hypothetical protein